MRFQLRRQASAAEAALRRIVGNRQDMRQVSTPTAGFLAADHRRIALGAKGLHTVIILCRALLSTTLNNGHHRRFAEVAI
jgi:hypothetical protein